MSVGLPTCARQACLLRNRLNRPASSITTAGAIDQLDWLERGRERGRGEPDAGLCPRCLRLSGEAATLRREPVEGTERPGPR